MISTKTGNENPGIGVFLSLLANDIKVGNVVALPEDLLRSMMANLRQPFELGDALKGEFDSDIVGEVEL